MEIPSDVLSSTIIRWLSYAEPKEKTGIKQAPESFATETVTVLAALAKSSTTARTKKGYPSFLRQLLQPCVWQQAPSWRRLSEANRCIGTLRKYDDDDRTC